MAGRNSTRRQAPALCWRTAGWTGFGRLSVSLLLAALATTSQTARADEGGISFWLPGQYASFAAVAPDLGFCLPMQSYCCSGNAGADKALDRANMLSFGLDTAFFGEFFVPDYTPNATPGARPGFSIAFYPGGDRTSADVALGSRSVSRTDEITGFGDPYPTAQLFRNQGVHSSMAYVTRGTPVGDYDLNQLANLGIGHAAIDPPGAYTCLNTKTGRGFSATAGLTYNFENPDADYTSGIYPRLDLGASRFLNEQLFVGAVGFTCVQLTADHGQPAAFGRLRRPHLRARSADRIQLHTERRADLQLRGYRELDVENRTEGGSVFLTVSLPIPALAMAKGK